MKIGFSQLNPTIGDLQGNQRKILQAYQQLCEQGAKLVLTPELGLIGYPPQDILLQKDFENYHQVILEELLSKIGSTPLLLGTVTPNQLSSGPPWKNSALLLQDQKIKAQVDKIALPNFDVFDERRYFQPGSNNPLLTIGEEKIGVAICADLWNTSYLPEELALRIYPNHPLENLIEAGATMLVALSASPFALGKKERRLRLLQAHAAQTRLPILYCNAVGGQDALLFDGNSIAMSAGGNCWETLPHGQEAIKLIDTRQLTKPPREAASQAQDTQQSYLSQLETPKQKDHHLEKPNSPLKKEQLRDHDLEELYQMLLMGIRDYVEKCGFKQVLLGLSGGIDSALVATLAQAALGADCVLPVMLPGPYSSVGSLQDAQQLISNLAIEGKQLSITPLYEKAGEILLPSLTATPSATLSTTSSQDQEQFPSLSTLSGLTSENLQARFRGTLLMALSNELGALLLTTGNKSELAVGYCTLYGDMCGGLSVIGDLFKTKVYALAHWINRNQEIIPASTLQKPPSAELRPDQTDQDSLPDYPILDRILELYLEEAAGADEIIAQGFKPSLVEEIIRLIHYSEYKRQQAPPILRVTDKAFGSGRRWPMAKKYMPIKNDC